MDEWDDIAEQWHNNEAIEVSLPEYMGLNEVEYMRFVHNITEPNLSDEEIFEGIMRTLNVTGPL